MDGYFSAYLFILYVLCSLITQHALSAFRKCVVPAHRFTIMLDRQDVLAKRNLNLSDGRDGEVVTSPKPFGDFRLPFTHSFCQIALCPAFTLTTLHGAMEGQFQTRDEY